MTIGRVRIVYVVGHDEALRRKLMQELHQTDLGAKHDLSPQQLLQAIVAAGGCTVLSQEIRQELEKVLRERLKEKNTGDPIVVIKASDKATTKKRGK